MAITINGTGSITGITAGGYPDATVTADDLAATLDLSGKTITLPSGIGGKIIKVTSHEINNLTISTAGSWGGSTTPTMANTYGVSSFDVTMSSVNNYLVCSASIMVDATGTNGHETVAIFDDTSGETDILIASSTQYRRVASSEPICYGLSFYYEPGATSGNTSTTRSLKIRCHSGASSTMYFGRNDSGDYDNVLTYINVFEVAA
jgi:hypothetical protein